MVIILATRGQIDRPSDDVIEEKKKLIHFAPFHVFMILGDFGLIAPRRLEVDLVFTFPPLNWCSRRQQVCLQENNNCLELAWKLIDR